MSNYTYTEADFLNANIVDINDIQNQINNLGLISAQVQYINYSVGVNGSFTVDIYFNNQLSVNDAAAVTNLINNYIYVSYDNISARISDKKDPGTNGGTFNSGMWVTRPLNTIEGSQNFCILNNNQFTLIAGNYHLEIGACACGVQNHQFRLMNVSNNSVVDVSLNGYTTGNNDFLSLAVNINITEPTSYEIQHQCVNSVINYGFGRSVGFGEPEVYCYIEITKLNL